MPNYIKPIWELMGIPEHVYRITQEHQRTNSLIKPPWELRGVSESMYRTMQEYQRLNDLVRSPLDSIIEPASYKAFREAQYLYNMIYPPHMREFHRELRLRSDKGLNANRVKSLRKFIKFLEKNAVIFNKRRPEKAISFKSHKLPINKMQLLEALKKWEKIRVRKLERLWTMVYSTFERDFWGENEYKDIIKTTCSVNPNAARVDKDRFIEFLKFAFNENQSLTP